ncbi:DsbC family protein [Paenalcaligenes suwonensis]|uniref:DsbC family protein n=1 Tax=Paenalcaligenes suwonensis TaxID=1202713 RepID=UPI0014076D8D|nr:DsbC family protein [Paenalcaligenes suwonensis]NHC60902.1 DsbC family protein [Paenalcaligenes suwonensis]
MQVKTTWSSCLITALVFSVGLGVAGTAQAQSTDYPEVRQKLEATFVDIAIDEIRPTPFPGLLEVRIGNELVYVNPEVDFLMQGSLVDVKQRIDLTSQRKEELNKVDFSQLPLDKAIKTVKGDGSRQMVVFEDPNCIYCKKLHTEIKDMDNVTIYSMMYPILSPDSATKAESIWCAENPNQALSDWMLSGTEPTARTCEHPIKDILAAGMSMDIRGTPAIIFEDGSRISGFLPKAQLEAKLAQSSKP